MKYQALYRKYRPDSFEQTAGQSSIVKTLKNALSQNKISHAYLFTGPRGTGKTTIAKLLAKTVNCKCRQELEPCNECDMCKSTMNNQNPDIVEIDAASNNGVDEIREIRNKVNLSPSMSTYKVYIIDEVHMLSTGAFNALLKTLEEPPSHIIFILATTDPQKLPATIISRCQRFDFRKVSMVDMVKRLDEIQKQESYSLDSIVLNEIAAVSDGGMRDAISLLDQLITFKGNDVSIEDVHEINGTITNDEVYEFVMNFLDNDLDGLLTKLLDYDNNGKSMYKIAELLMLRLRDILIYKKAYSYFSKTNQIELPVVLLEKIDVNIQQQLYELIKNLEEMLKSIKNTTNSRLLLELVFLRNSDINAKELIEISNTQMPKEEKKISVKESEILITESEISVSVDNAFEDEGVSIQNVDNTKTSELEEKKKVCVNNTLYYFDKDLLNTMRSRWGNIRRYMTDPTLGGAASLLLDGKLQVAGKDNIILVYKVESMAIRFNYENELPSKLLSLVFGERINAIGVTVREWDDIFKEYQRRKKENIPYEFMMLEKPEIKNENLENNDIIESIEEEAKSLFGEELIEVE